jgi:hypothetical protein
MKRRQYRKYIPSEEMYIVVNQNGEVFAGLKGGYPHYSNDWSQAKPLYKENTTLLLRDEKTELIKESEL